MGGGRECHSFPSKICCLTVPKNFVGEPFCVSENSWYRKDLWIRGVEGESATIRNRKNIWHDSDSNQGPTASEPCCPNPPAVIYFWIKRVGNFGLKKKEKRPYRMDNFSCILHMRRKIMKSPIRNRQTNCCYYELNIHTVGATWMWWGNRCMNNIWQNFLAKFWMYYPCLSNWHFHQLLAGRNIETKKIISDFRHFAKTSSCFSAIVPAVSQHPWKFVGMGG